jgi:prepilin-type N-terminal cleavage/methylation domain-containing protein
MASSVAHYKAFTLLELLVAMTLMVVTAACLYTALYTGFRAKKSAQLAVEPTSLAINAIELIKQDTYGVLPLGGTLAGSFLGTNAQDTKGLDTDSLEFYTTHIYSDSSNLVGGLGKIELLLEEDDDEDLGEKREGYRLMRKITTNLLSPKTTEPEEQVLCRNVKSLNLRYYDEENGWLDEWDSTADANSLPLAMEIDIQVLHNGTGINNSKESQTRRLIQSFNIPCGGAKEETETTGTTGTGGSQMGL